MTKAKRWLSGLTAGAVLVSGMAILGNGGGTGSSTLNGVPEIAASADDTEYTYGDYLTYVYLDDGTIEVSGCDTSVTEIEIPSEIDGVAVTSIGDCAFYNCTFLTSVTIPDSVTSIGYEAFCNTAILNNQDGPVYYVDTWVADCDTDVTSVDIMDGARGIAGYAFYDCTSLISITIPDSVTSIGDCAFCECTSLTSITIPDSVTSIGNNAFDGCTSLTSITIPDSVTSIGNNAFYDCTSLESVTIGNSVTSIGRSAFDNTGILNNQDGPVYYADTWIIDCDTDVTSVEITDDTRGIADEAFRSCTSLTSITIPDSVTSIGDSVFRNCYSLTSITIPDSVTSIGDSAFYDCKSLTSITIPDSVTSIEEETFFCCTGLTSITIPDSVTSIGYGAFKYCESITSITIPDSVTSIGNSAFYKCYRLTSIIILNPDCEIYDSESTMATGVVWTNGTYTEYYHGNIIYGYTNSTAQTYAETYGYSFVSLDDYSTGDLDADGTVTLNDSYLTLVAYANAQVGMSSDLNYAQESAADIDDDGSITINDAYYILLYYAQSQVGLNPTWEELLNG